MTEINAYNVCNQAVGQARVASIDTFDPDVAEIKNHLDEVTREYLTRGWNFNTDIITLLVDNNTGRIPTSGYLSVYLPASLSHLVSRKVEGEESSSLWDPEKNEWYAKTISSVEVVVNLPWDSIPPEVQDAIAYSAAVSYLLQVKGPVAEAVYYERKAYSYLGNAEATYMSSNYSKNIGLSKLLASFVN